jgi:toxin ParE1/3/4
LKVEIRPAAQSDLDQIFSYSLSRHGQAAADQYLPLFYASLEKIRDFPASAPARIGLNGARGLSFGRHIIFYEIQTAKIVILRVLHQAMDTTGRF